jgi:hypothetical protein
MTKTRDDLAALSKVGSALVRVEDMAAPSWEGAATTPLEGAATGVVVVVTGAPCCWRSAAAAGGVTRWSRSGHSLLATAPGMPSPQSCTARRDASPRVGSGLPSELLTACCEKACWAHAGGQTKRVAGHPAATEQVGLARLSVLQQTARAHRTGAEGLGPAVLLPRVNAADSVAQCTRIRAPTSKRRTPSMVSGGT